MDAKRFLEQFQDYLSPKLDTYEQVIYLYVVRRSRLRGECEAVIGFKSARRQIALGIGTAGSPMSEKTCYDKLRSLEKKKCLEIIGTEHLGTRVRVALPDEIPGLITTAQPLAPISLEEEDFFEIAASRQRILKREGNRCFYCLRVLNEQNYVIEHVRSRPQGDNSYRNVVAACRECNNRKGDSAADDFLRLLYRESALSADEFADRILHLQRLRAGELKPPPP